MKLDLLQMSRDEKIRAMHELWEDLARDDQAVQSPAWHEDPDPRLGFR
ncbi:MAG: addiction module protein [Limisphaerales bacterium]